MSKFEKIKELLLHYHNKRFKIPNWISLMLLLFGSFAVNYAVFHVGPVPFSELFAARLAAYPSLLYLNWIPILLVMLLLWLCTNNSPLSITVGGGIFLILGIANQFKVTLRQDPLLPTDISLAREAISVLRSFPPETKSQIKLLLVCIVLVILITALLFRGRKINTAKRLCAIAFTLACALFMNAFYYSSAPFYNRFPVEGNIYFPVNHYNSKGFIYSFLHNFNTMKIKKPLGYLASEYDKLEDAPVAVPFDTEKPHIIMIMGEAFSDLSNNENLDFSNYVDPMENFKKLCDRDEAISGHIIVPNFGGGTSNTEYDVLTACPTRYLDNALPSYNFVRKAFDAMPRRLKEIGYDTQAIHPGYYWFYNRHNVYQSFGFDDFIHLEAYDTASQSRGGYISEKDTMDTIINTLDKHIAQSDKPLFEFIVTIQNHGPYEQKYGDTRKSFDTDIPLTDLEGELLDNYFNGLKDVDRELGRLVSYMEESDEPIVLVYFGDHLPGFSNGMDFFSLLNYDINIDGSVKERIGAYETPFVIWQNESAKAITPIGENIEKAKLQEETVISSNYLGALLMELLGYNGLSPLYDFANQLRKELPVIAGHSYLNQTGEYVEEITQEQQTEVDMLKGWQYYKLFDQKVSD